MSKGRVLVAMSGGVDSSVAAALLLEQGYECIGATMQLWSPELPRAASETGCCSIYAVEDARRVAAKLGIPYYVFNMADEFTEKVVDSFADAYMAGYTPNPCIVCNKELKFGAFLAKARALGCDYVATGHYARVYYDNERGRYILAKGRDSQKDQSYALYVLTQEQLAHALFPLGDMKKEETRAIAARLGLRVATKPDSQEICFVPDNDYRQFLRDYRPESQRPGPIVDTGGKVLGQHAGLAFYTIGQRKGLGITAPTPLYVVDIVPATNTIVVGTADEVRSETFVTADVNWVAIAELSAPLAVEARIRYRVQPAPAQIEPMADGRVITRLATAQRAVTPGQSVVWYSGDLVIGGGIIQSRQEI